MKTLVNAPPNIYFFGVVDQNYTFLKRNYSFLRAKTFLLLKSDRKSKKAQHFNSIVQWSPTFFFEGPLSIFHMLHMVNYNIQGTPCGSRAGNPWHSAL